MSLILSAFPSILTQVLQANLAFPASALQSAISVEQLPFSREWYLEDKILMLVMLTAFRIFLLPDYLSGRN